VHRFAPGALIGALSVIAALALAHLWRGEVVSLVLDADIDRGSVIELFHNDLWTSSQRDTVRPGRSQYRFDGLPPTLWSLRLDPTDDRSARVRIYGLRVVRGTETLREFSPPEIGRWVSGGLLVTSSSSEVLELRSTNDDPMLFVPGTLAFPGGNALSTRLASTSPELLFGLAFVLFLLAGALPWRGWAAAALPVLLPAIAMLSTLVQKAVTRAIGTRLGGYLSPVEAVGAASWLGYPKAADFRVYWLTLVLSIALGALGGLALARFAAVEGAEVPPEPAWRRLAAMLVVGLLFLYALLSFPSLAGRLDQLQHQTHQLGYDDGNLFIWAYLVHTGGKPFVDFWYPYGGFAGFGAGGWFPWGDLLSWVHQLFLLCVAGWALLRLTRTRPLTAPLLLAVLLAGYLTWNLSGGERYLLGLDVALVGLAAREDGYPRGELIFLAVFAAYTFFLEPTQLIPGAASLSVLLGEDLWLDPAGRRPLLRKVLPASGVFLSGVLLIVGGRLVRGQLPGWLEFYGQFGAMTTYGALPAAFREWYRFVGSTNNVLLFAPLFLLALAAALRVRDGRMTSPAAFALTCGLLGAFSFNKFLVRPHVGSQVVVYSIVGLALVVSRLYSSLRAAQRVMLLVVGMALVWVALDSEDGARLGRQFRALRSLPANVATLVGDQSADELAYYEDPRRYPEQLQLIERLRTLTAASEGRPATKVFVLGDDVVLYPPLGKPTPYYLSIYNSSPLEAQERSLAWLHRESPEWVVWRPDFASFDGVPNVVRTPLLYRAVVLGYEPFERVGRFEILRRRADPSGPIDLGFWATRVGTTLDLGALPAISPLSRFAPCGTEHDCVAALRIDVEHPVKGRRRVLPVEVAGKRFEIQFSELPAQRTYHVRLDRIWFWSRPGDPPPLVASFDAGPGARVEQVWLSPRRSSLW
jgi:hypothetical protein